MDVDLIKTPAASLVPSLERDRQKLERIKAGEIVTVTLKVRRKAKFLRKFFALLEYAFDIWEPEVALYKGQRVRKDFDQFREDLIVLAGFYTTTICLDGRLKLKAKSISFDAMPEEEEFARLYHGVAQVILDKVLTNYTRDELDEQVSRVLGFL